MILLHAACWCVSRHLLSANEQASAALTLTVVVACYKHSCMFAYRCRCLMFSAWDFISSTKELSFLASLLRGTMYQAALEADFAGTVLAPTNAVSSLGDACSIFSSLLAVATTILQHSSWTEHFPASSSIIYQAETQSTEFPSNLADKTA